MLGAVIMTGLSNQMGMFFGTTIAFLELSIRYPAPLEIGATVHLEMTPTDIHHSSKPGRGVLTMDFERSGIAFHREIFVSHPAGVLCVRLTSDTPASMDVDVRLDRVPLSDEQGEDERRPGLKTKSVGWPSVCADELRALPSLPV